MSYYTYDYSLTGKIGENISEAVKQFAQEGEGRTYDCWYHDLPVWIVRHRIGNRVNRVQVDAVLIPATSKQIISFTPDAYEDVSVRGGVKRVVAPAETIIDADHRVVLSHDEAEVRTSIDTSLKEAWGRAEKLELSGTKEEGMVKKQKSKPK